MNTILNILSQSSAIVTTTTISAWLYNMNFHTTAFVSGALACAALGRLLKNTIKQPRPNVSPKSHSFGMPSSHAQTISYFGVHLALSAGYYLAPTPSKFIIKLAGVSSSQLSHDIFVHAVDNLTSYWSLTPTQQNLLCTTTQIISLGLALLIAWSRYELKYHTVSQVLVGWSIGTLFAFAWFRFTFLVLHPLYLSYLGY